MVAQVFSGCVLRKLLKVTERPVENYAGKKKGNFIHVSTSRRGFPGSSVVKNPPATAGDAGSVLGLRIQPKRRKWQPTPVFLPGKSHGKRSLVGYSPWSRKEWDTTKH